jgi:predicted RecA/RadA family phage recombinase
MQATYIQAGREIDYTPGSAVAAGQVVVQQNLVGIAKTAIAANALGALSVSGIFDVDQAAEAITAGSPVYWDADGNSVSGTAGAGAATATASGNTFMGFAQATTEATDSYVRIALRSAETVAGGVATATSITGTASTLPIAGLAAAQGGTATLTGGASSTAANAGGAVALTGGVGGAEGAGGAATVAGGAGGSTSGTGGAVTVAGGAGSAGNANGGALTLRGGAKHGSGTHGAVSIGATNTASVTIAAASVATIIGGPVTASVGASTIAAGADNTDAAALPAGTASVYPTTAADNDKGVIINAADKVTGRMLLIGNGVGNKTLKVYPPSGGNINGLGANAAFSSVSGKGVIIVCLSSGDNTWLAW